MTYLPQPSRRPLFLACFALVWLCVQLHSAFAGSCAAPTVISCDGGFEVSGELSTGIDAFSTQQCFGSMMAWRNELVYELPFPTEQSLTLTLTNLSSDLIRVGIVTSCDNTWNACVGGFEVAGGQAFTGSFFDVGPATFYLVVEARGFDGGSFNLKGVCFPGVNSPTPTPTNTGTSTGTPTSTPTPTPKPGSCLDPAPLICDQITRVASAGLGQDEIQGVPCFGAGWVGGNELIFRHTLEEQSLLLTMNNLDANPMRVGIVTDCGSGWSSCIGGFDVGPGETISGAFPFIGPGQFDIIFESQVPAGGSGGVFTFSAQCYDGEFTPLPTATDTPTTTPTFTPSPTPTVAFPENNCGATPISCGQTLSADTSGKPNSYTDSGCSGFPNNGGEVIYTFTVLENARVTFAVRSLAQFGVEFTLANDCDGSYANSSILGRESINTGDVETFSADLPFGRYYIVCDPFNAGVGVEVAFLSCDPIAVSNLTSCRGLFTPQATYSPTPTNTSAPTDTPTSEPTGTPTGTPTSTGTPTGTPTPEPTDTPTDTPTSTNTPTSTATPSATPTDTGTPTFTSTPTNTGTPTNTPVFPANECGAIEATDFFGVIPKSKGRYHDSSCLGSALPGGEVILTFTIAETSRVEVFAEVFEEEQFATITLANDCDGSYESSSIESFFAETHDPHNPGGGWISRNLPFGRYYIIADNSGDMNLTVLLTFGTDPMPLDNLSGCAGELTLQATRTPTPSPVPSPTSTPTPAPQSYTISVQPGWNARTLAGAPTAAVSMEMLTLLTRSRVALWMEHGRWRMLNGARISAFNITPLALGEGVLLYGNEPGSFEYQGLPVEFFIHQLEAGWNFIGIPEAEPGLMASRVVTIINGTGGSCRRVVRFAAGRWQSYQPEIGLLDFPITRETPVLVYVDGPWSGSFSDSPLR